VSAKLYPQNSKKLPKNPKENKPKAKTRKPRKGKGVPKETPTENCLDNLQRALELGFPAKNFSKLKTTISANGYFEATMSQQLGILARVSREMVGAEKTEKQSEKLIEALAKSDHEKIRGVAATVVRQTRPTNIAWQLQWLKFTGSVFGTWPRELSQGYLHMLIIEQSVNAIFPRIKPWLDEKNEAVRRLVIEATRPKGVMLPHIAELKENAQALRPFLEKVLDDKSDYVRKAAANNINDISKTSTDAVVSWCKSWLKPGSSDERAWIIARGLRTLVNEGQAAALKLMGYCQTDSLDINWIKRPNAQIEINELIPIELELTNKSNIPALVHVIMWLDEPGKNGRRKSKYQIWRGRLKKQEHKLVGKQIHFVDKNSQPRLTGDYVASIKINGDEVGRALFTWLP